MRVRKYCPHGISCDHRCHQAARSRSLHAVAHTFSHATVICAIRIAPSQSTSPRALCVCGTSSGMMSAGVARMAAQSGSTRSNAWDTPPWSWQIWMKVWILYFAAGALGPILLRSRGSASVYGARAMSKIIDMVQEICERGTPPLNRSYRLSGSALSLVRFLHMPEVAPKGTFVEVNGFVYSKESACHQQLSRRRG